MDKNYNPVEIEPRWMDFWQQSGVYHFDPASERPIYSIDTPPPRVSGHLHLGHVYSYSHADFMARFFRMRGRNVYYPMGFDDNGQPTERLVEKRFGLTSAALGLSIDWRYTYRSIEPAARRIEKLSFLKLCQMGRAYRRSAPTIWCPVCRTAVAQVCACGGRDFVPDPDVMDTWATSSMSPQIAGRWLEDPELYGSGGTVQSAPAGP